MSDFIGIYKGKWNVFSLFGYLQAVYDTLGHLLIQRNFELEEIPSRDRIVNRKLTNKRHLYFEKNHTLLCT